MSRRPGLGLSCIALAALAALAACGRQADIVIRGAMVWTGLSSGAPQPGAVAIGDGEILAVGDSVTVARYVGSSTRVIRADGGLVLPGLADAHTHFIGGGFQLASGALRHAPTPEQRDSALARALAHAASLGVTATAHMSASWADLASYRRLEGAGRLTMRVALYLPVDTWRAVAESAKAHGAGDAWVKIGGLKGYMDGSAGSRTALFFEPYTDSAGYRGLMQNPERDMRSWIGNADSAGLQVAVHAIGDRANALILAIYDSVIKVHGPRDRRFRVEHAQHLRPQDIPLFGTLGVIASMQPYHAIDDGRWVERRIGPVRIKTTYAFRTLLDTGAKLAFGSDWTVAPLDPLAGVYAAVTRRTLDDKNPNGWVPEQKITVGEALRAYTAGNAFATFDETKRGALAPGFYADVVVVDRNLFALPAESLAAARVRVTIVGGKVVYEKR